MCQLHKSAEKLDWKQILHFSFFFLHLFWCLLLWFKCIGNVSTRRSVTRVTKITTFFWEAAYHSCNTEDALKTPFFFLLPPKISSQLMPILGPKGWKYLGIFQSLPRNVWWKILPHNPTLNFMFLSNQLWCWPSFTWKCKIWKLAFEGTKINFQRRFQMTLTVPTVTDLLYGHS